MMASMMMYKQLTYNCLLWNTLETVKLFLNWEWWAGGKHNNSMWQVHLMFLFPYKGIEDNTNKIIPLNYSGYQ